MPCGTLSAFLGLDTCLHHCIHSKYTLNKSTAFWAVWRSHMSSAKPLLRFASVREMCAETRYIATYVSLSKPVFVTGVVCTD